MMKVCEVPCIECALAERAGYRSRVICTERMLKGHIMLLVEKTIHLNGDIDRLEKEAEEMNDMMHQMKHDEDLVSELQNTVSLYSMQWSREVADLSAQLDAAKKTIMSQDWVLIDSPTYAPCELDFSLPPPLTSLFCDEDFVEPPTKKRGARMSCRPPSQKSPTALRRSKRVRKN